MKKLLSILLVVSTLFLSLGVQVSFAKWDNYSPSYEEYQKDLEIQRLKERLKNETKKNNETSFWGKVKSVSSSILTACAGLTLAMIPIGIALTAAYYPGKALIECSNDPNCHFDFKGNNTFFAKMKNIKFYDAIKNTRDIFPTAIKGLYYFMLIDNTKNNKK